jgi:hypothetical protein
MNKLSFEEFSYIIRAELIIKDIEIEELPDENTLKEYYNKSISISEVVKSLISEIKKE